MKKRPTHVCPLLFLIACIFFLHHPRPLGAEGPNLFEVSKDGAIKGSFHNVPLSDVLKSLSRSASFDLKGPYTSSEPISGTFSELTLDEALKRVLRGYNYVLVGPEKTGRPVLIVLGKTSRATYPETKAPALSAQPPTAGLPASAPHAVSEQAQPVLGRPLPPGMPQRPQSQPPPPPSSVPTQPEQATSSGPPQGAASLSLAIPGTPGQESADVQGQQPGQQIGSPFISTGPADPTTPGATTTSPLSSSQPAPGAKGLEEPPHDALPSGLSRSGN